MPSIDSSVRDFIAHPENHHLENIGGVIKALPGRLPTDETVHKIALDALNALSTEQGSSPSGLASFFTSVTSIFRSSNSSLIQQCQQAEFIYKIDKWAQEPGQGPGENRAEAAIRIKNAYTLKDSILELKNLRLTSLPPAIGQLAQLQQLDLTANQLTTFPLEIAQLAQLKVLDLTANQFTILPPAIAQLTQLQKLGLRHNQFTNLPPAIAQLTQLKMLFLNHNQFTTLPPAIAQLTQLQQLFLNDNQFTTLPPAIAQLTQLQQLDLTANQLTTFPLEIAQLGQLKVLDLRYNQLTTLPPEIGQLAQLQGLDLSHNQLTTFPLEIAQLAQLKVLDLTANQFTILPPAIAQLTQLQKLGLRHNQFTNLPPAIAQLTQLQRLFLNHNQFTTLPPEIAQLTQLQQLFLNDNQFTNLPPAIAQLGQLKVLDLSHNHLSTLAPEIAQLAQLKMLFLSNNPLTNNKTPIQIIASCPFLLTLSTSIRIADQDTINNSHTMLDNPQTLQEICQLNGLALEFIPEHRQTEDLVLTAITQNPASIAFARPDLMTYELVKRAVAINPNTARFVPDHLIDIPTVVREIEKEPYLLTLFLKKAPLETLQEELTKNKIKPKAEGAPDTIIKAEDVIQAAIGYDGRIISFIPADIQASDFGHDLIIQALEQTPLAYYGIDPVFFNQDLFTLMMARHKDHPDLEPILKHILSLMDTEDTALRDKMLNLAYPLSQYFHDDKDIILMLISKYGISLQDISDDLKADYDIVFAAIHHDPGEITYSQVTDPSEKKILQQYAKERRRQLNR